MDENTNPSLAPSEAPSVPAPEAPAETSAPVAQESKARDLTHDEIDLAETHLASKELRGEPSFEEVDKARDQLAARIKAKTEEELHGKARKTARQNKRAEFWAKNATPEQKELAELRRRTAELEEMLKKQEPRKTRKDYATDDDYVRALADERIQEALSTVGQQAQQSQQAQQALQSRASSWRAKTVRCFGEENAQQALDAISHIPFDRLGEDVSAFIEESPIGPALGVAMVQEPEIIEALANASPYRRAGLLARLEQNLGEMAARASAPKTAEPPARPSPEPTGSLSGSAPSGAPGDSMARVSAMMAEAQRRGY